MGKNSIGIDLGTTYSCVGIWKDDKVEIIPNDHGNRFTPSYIAFSYAVRLIGENAKNQISMNPFNTIYDAKRLIGRQFNDPEVQLNMNYWPFQVIDMNGRPYIQVTYKGKIKQFSPVEILSMLLCKLKDSAEIYLKERVTVAVITVDSNYNDSQRQAIRDAANIAGLSILRLISGPIAAAIAYKLDNRISVEGNIVIVDFGGGSLDVSLITNIGEGVLEVMATAGDAHLGGEDFNKRIVNYFISEFKRKFKKDITTDKRALCRLRTACERAKCTLSSSKQAFIEIDSIFESIDFHTSLTRDVFINLNQDLIQRIIDPVEKVLRDARIDKSQIHEVILVGGSTRIPEIQKIISNFFNGKELNKSFNPDEVIAYGAAVKAACLSGVRSGKLDNILNIDVAPHSLGIESAGGIMNPIIKRNDTIPTRKSKIFTTDLDNQTNFIIKVYEGERVRTVDNNLLGEFELTDIPPAPKGVPQIEVTFDIDSSGFLEVLAFNKNSGQHNKFVVTNDKNRLSNKEIEQMIKDAMKYHSEDKNVKQKEQARNNFERYLGNLQNALQKTITWFDDNQGAEKEEYERKREYLINQVLSELEEFQINN
ncbi:5427_t:CDS:2 [Acaulospora morrowiae]|uniref:5427_t:CDS:1 n=1 Tax=Acaulospora morrowiae TaxID=94023 RepID=A0A9N9CXG9_9GLOM|nr:5427_t:CDS:2 [Acaulospora morrowiae]